MLFVLDPQSTEPLYRQLKTAIIEALEAGEYRGRALPSSRSLATEMGISRTTVNLAFQELVADGYLYSAPRSGFWANERMFPLKGEAPPPRIPTSSDESLSIQWEKRLKDLGSGTIPTISIDQRWREFPYQFVGSSRTRV